MSQSKLKNTSMSKSPSVQRLKPQPMRSRATAFVHRQISSLVPESTVSLSERRGSKMKIQTSGSISTPLIFDTFVPPRGIKLEP